MRLYTVGPTPAAARCISGIREGEALFFRHDQHPKGALGLVKFLWRPCCPEADAVDRQVWLWVHPSCYKDFLGELKAVFNFKETKRKGGKEPEECATPETDAATTRGKDADQTQFANKEDKPDKKTVDDVRPSGLNNMCCSNGKITMRCLKDQLCRFNLSGPLSHSILLDLLKVADVNNPTRKETMMDIDAAEPASEVKDKWWQTYFSDSAATSHHQQCSLWGELRGLQSAGELTDRVVLGLTVRDPRVFLPQKKMRVVDDPSGED